MLRIKDNSNTLSSFSYTQIINNSKFDNTNGWTADKSTLAVADNILSKTGLGNGAAPYAQCNISTLATDIAYKIYTSAKMRVTNSICEAIYLNIRFPNTLSLTTSSGVIAQNTPVENIWYNFNSVCQVQSTVQTGNLIAVIQSVYSSSANALGKALQIKDLLVVNLTTIYGAGNEPNATDCANIFKFAEGTKQSNFSKTFAT